ncbi:MAG: amidohydrolase family protein [Balneolales bacterium]|nr:amidohydrolase family protein [Balneolales bacterium]
MRIYLASVLKRIVVIVGVLLIALTAWLWFIVNDLPKALEPRIFEQTGVLFNNVRLLSMDPEAPISQDSQAVLVMGNRITEIGATGEIHAPDGVLIIDGRGYTLMPGLIDAHIHLNDEAELAAYLAHGVTGLRNLSGYPFHLRLIDRISNGQLISPDFITTGPILNSHGPNENVLQSTVTTAEEARQAVRAQHKAGYRIIKVYSNLTREAFDAIIDEATNLDMTVIGHSPEGVRTRGIPREKPFDIPWEASLGRGFTTLEHIETLVWHSLRGDLDQEKMRSVATALATSGEAITPTLYAHKRLVLIAESEGAYLDRPGSDMINPLTTWFSKSAAQYWSQVDPSAYEAPHAEFFLIATGLLHEAGVHLLTGTDAGVFGVIPGASVARELELLIASGLTPYEALSSATRVNAKSLGFEQTGMILPGYRANLVLVPNDPLEDIGAVEFPSGVMIGGYWLDEQALEAMKSSARDSKITSFIRSLMRVIEMKLFAL